MLFLIVKRRLLIGRRLFLFPRLAAQTMPGSKAPTKAPAARGNPDPVGVGGRRNKASRGARRHVARAGRAFCRLDVVPHPRQSLEPSSRGTTSPGLTGHSAAPTWCFPPAKALILRCGAPRRPRPTGPPRRPRRPAALSEASKKNCRRFLETAALIFS